jgi:creatinine amidohydrolase
MRPWKLAEINYDHVKAGDYEVAVLPLGAIEPHNLHLPYGTDLFESELIGERICGEAHEAGGKVILLPAIPYGTETNLREFPFAMNLNPSTLNAVIADLVASLAHQGLRKIVLLNSHGGNDLKPTLRELYGRNSAALFLCNWYQMVDDVYSDIFAESDDHAGEMETSIALAYFPDLVARDEEGNLVADRGETSGYRFEALQNGWVSVTRPWHLLTSNAGVGDPHAATAEKGRELLDVIAGRLVPFLVELSDSELDDRFPF